MNNVITLSPVALGLMIVMIAVMVMAMASVVFAAPGGPWVPVLDAATENQVLCDHPSSAAIDDGELWHNTQSGKDHCFKA